MEFLNFMITFLEEGTNQLEQVAQQILDLVQDIVMPAFWIGIGAFLIIKGSMIGAQIVKAADEPEVRQEKINSLKYLLIGVLIAALIAAIAMGIVDFVQTQFEPID